MIWRAFSGSQSEAWLDTTSISECSSNTLKAASFIMTLSAAVSWPGMIATLPDLPLSAPHSLTMSSAISRPIRSQFAPTKAVEGWFDCRLICSTLMPSDSACLICRASSCTVGLCTTSTSGFSLIALASSSDITLVLKAASRTSNE